MKRGFAVVVLGLSVLALGAQGRELVYEKGAGVYEIALLQLLLERTVPQYGAFHLRELGEDLSEQRALEELNRGRFDVTFLVLTKEREEAVLPIRVDLTRGIQGYRVFLIRKENQERFTRVRTLGDLRAFTAGFGAQWGDLPVLAANQLPVVTATQGSALYPMLQAGRFDYFPRGINEAWDNLEQHAKEAPDMVVEGRLALWYPLVQCFAVAKGNTALAERIQKGLDAVWADGSMKALFLKYHQEFIRKAKLAERRVFVLGNPNLPAGGPKVDTSWWLPKN